MAATAQQRTFDPRHLDKAAGRAETFRNPVIKLTVAAEVLGLSEKDVVAEIFSGRLRWAWNLSASDNRAFVIVLTRSVVAWLLEKDNTHVWQPGTIEEAIKQVLTPVQLAQVFLPGKELKKLFRVGNHHIANLVASRALAEVVRPAHAAHSGVNGTRKIITASVVELLTKRQAPWN